MQSHSDAKPLRDPLVAFARKVAEEYARKARLPGSTWCVMLREDEAHELVAEINRLVQEGSVCRR